VGAVGLEFHEMGMVPEVLVCSTGELAICGQIIGFATRGSPPEGI